MNDYAADDPSDDEQTASIGLPRHGAGRAELIATGIVCGWLCVSIMWGSWSIICLLWHIARRLGGLR